MTCVKTRTILLYKMRKEMILFWYGSHFTVPLGNCSGRCNQSCLNLHYTWDILLIDRLAPTDDSDWTGNEKDRPYSRNSLLYWCKDKTDWSCFLSDAVFSSKATTVGGRSHCCRNTFWNCVLVMEVTSTSETSTNFCQSTQSNDADSHLYTWRLENLK